ncbi:Transcriptional regulator, AcrR family [Pseudomonas chlororaphis subsp. aurantiaca]|uniref:Transcriptional regulator, TetR family n=1 Tax=Pseudomonas chlororaphis O6 TaxID=1037915 RepID=A0AB33WP67_9PSED|nr:MULTISPECIES: TetR/AcrR family transcriptional regulator [Pseudomonas]AZD35932.1 Transcriptional regulator, AcrR family [Pseudomonas chlororaphis subsp. aurantiaca]AZD42269.1 Transcriptional regulator, AcrR family [Pseudomonas chlororaphis subsp. aurantiaca]AZD66960.1 Transcriptional regulator, AcrR family [Pseudomonas chlororaphis subsp. aurantiaca]AZD73437.1 Transcriptional regulator, AcrR family [Pseudomonas chlororaphis subsp. aurantiaca]AZE23621.1 Transcriptional regulator, AcrR family
MARMGAELRRQDFVEATVKVIAEHGVANATTRRIAAAAGCPLASLHYVFHTKDDLFYAVYESLFDLPHQALEHVPTGTTAAEKAAEVLRQLIAWLTSHPDVARAQTELFFWAMRNNPELANKIYSVAIDATEQALERAMGAQLEKPFLQAVSRLLIHLVDGLIIAWSAHDDLARLESETETACKALALLVASH